MDCFPALREITYDEILSACVSEVSVMPEPKMPDVRTDEFD